MKRQKSMIHTVIPSRKEKFVSLACTGDLTLSELTDQVKVS
jgi:hypothetical protein